MSRYVLTQDQLERLQEQIQELRRVNALKEERIRELELHKLRVSNSEVTDLLKTIANLEEDIGELKKANRRLTAEAGAVEANVSRMKDLEVLLGEERKLREYSETYARQMEQRYNEEMLLKNLTTELCQLQKAEIEIGNKKVENLQRKLKKYESEMENFHEKNEKEIKQVLTEQEKENIMKNKQLQSIILKLRKQMSKIYEEIQGKPFKTEEDKRRLRELDKWFKEIRFVMDDVTNIEELRKDLSYLRNEIESRRKSIVKFRF